MIDYMEFYKFLLNKTNLDKDDESNNLCIFKIIKSEQFNGEYIQKVLLKMEIKSIKDILEIVDENLKKDEFEFYLFNLNTDTKYDNKILGGRIRYKFNINKNNFNVSFFNHFKNLYKNNISTPIFEGSLPLNIIVKHLFLMFVNIKLYNIHHKDKIFTFIDGISISKDNVSGNGEIKIFIWINKNLEENCIKNLMIFIKSIIFGKNMPNVSLTYYHYLKTIKNKPLYN